MAKPRKPRMTAAEKEAKAEDRDTQSAEKILKLLHDSTKATRAKLIANPVFWGYIRASGNEEGMRMGLKCLTKTLEPKKRKTEDGKDGEGDEDTDESEDTREEGHKSKKRKTGASSDIQHTAAAAAAAAPSSATTQRSEEERAKDAADAAIFEEFFSLATSYSSDSSRGFLTALASSEGKAGWRERRHAKVVRKGVEGIHSVE